MKYPIKLTKLSNYHIEKFQTEKLQECRQRALELGAQIYTLTHGDSTQAWYLGVHFVNRVMYAVVKHVQDDNNNKGIVEKTNIGIKIIPKDMIELQKYYITEKNQKLAIQKYVVWEKGIQSHEEIDVMVI